MQRDGVQLFQSLRCKRVRTPIWSESIRPRPHARGLHRSSSCNNMSRLHQELTSDFGVDSKLASPLVTRRLACSFGRQRSQPQGSDSEEEEEGGNILHDNTYICLPFCSLSYRGVVFVAERCRGNRRLEVRGVSFPVFPDMLMGIGGSEEEKRRVKGNGCQKSGRNTCQGFELCLFVVSDVKTLDLHQTLYPP
ncbi:hypothetical protein GOODEAATRI_000461 [Goodea atripinnis]|uniref:Uncharacterized protein n=1 Tax=Goodea atripinnis TaxID=208336 RepID=A0ABV0PA71_9TELE